jgi:Flp pilus assembly protein TadD
MMVRFRALPPVVRVAGLTRFAVRAVVLSASCTGCASSVPLPPQAIALNAAGARAIAEGQLSVAEARLSVALEYSSRFVEAWVNLGYVELGRGNFAKAREDFTRARELNQDIPAPHHALGVLADAEGKGGEAERHYRDALRVDPGFGPARANLGRRLFATGRFEEARAEFERLAEVVPDMVEGYTGEAEALLRLGRQADARAVLARAQGRFAGAPDVRLLVARTAIECGEWAEAEAQLAPLVGGVDRRRAASAWSWIALARIGKGDAEGAREAAGAALAIRGDEAVARYALGLLPRAPVAPP